MLRFARSAVCHTHAMLSTCALKIFNAKYFYIHWVILERPSTSFTYTKTLCDMWPLICSNTFIPSILCAYTKNVVADRTHFWRHSIETKRQRRRLNKIKRCVRYEHGHQSSEHNVCSSCDEIRNVTKRTQPSNCQVHPNWLTPQSIRSCAPRTHKKLGFYIRCAHLM